MARILPIAALVSIASLRPLTFADDRFAFGIAGEIEARGSVPELDTIRRDDRTDSSEASVPHHFLSEHYCQGRKPGGQR
jgi:hypothetical protein